MKAQPHPTGALFLEEAQVALIADAHLGYGWAQRRRGELGPVHDDRSGGKLARVVDELSPREIVFLGDLVHAPRPGAEEKAFVEGILKPLAGKIQITVVRGNHDRHFLRDYPGLGLTPVNEWRYGSFTAIHGDRPHQHADGETLIIGHLHPSLRLPDAAGAKQRLPVFLIADDLIILPAFSPFAAGIDIHRGLTGTLQSWVGRRRVEVIAAAGNRTLKLGPLSQHGGKPQVQRNVPLVRK